MNRIICILVLIYFVPVNIKAQTRPQIFTQDKLIWLLDKYHPIATQGNLLLKKGESTVRKSRGGFDPYLNSTLSQKQFDSKNYYSLFNAALKVPTWYGVELKSGFDQNGGDFLNAENSVPSGGLWYAGISVPLAQGLFFDKRRATLKQAKNFAKATKAEQQQLMNNLYYDALKAYWKWVQVWNEYQVYEEAVSLAQTRFEAVKKSYAFGDKPAIDTLEAFIQVQNRQVNRNNYYLKYKNNTLALANFLWYENNTPLEITDSLRPPLFTEINLNEYIPSDSVSMWLDQLEIAHPNMQLYKYSIANLTLEKKLKVEGLKPKINVQYNALTEPVNNNVFANLSTENYKWGLAFSMPILLREQRGDLQLTKLKIQDTQLDQQQQLLSLKNKVKAYYNEQQTLQQQVVVYSDVVNNYDDLLKGERTKFSAGESSLFLVNSREINFIKAQLSLVKYTADFNVAHTALLWASGKLY